MTEVAPDNAPIFTIDTKLAASYSSISIDYDNLFEGMNDIGLPRRAYSNTAVHIADLGDDMNLGTAIPGGPIINKLYELPFFDVDGDLAESGFAPHQRNYRHKVVLNAANNDLLLSYQFSRRFGLDRSIFEGMRHGEFLSLVLAHELAHLLPKNKQGFIPHRAPKVEANIDKYLIDQINSDQASAWRSVIATELRKS